MDETEYHAQYNGVYACLMFACARKDFDKSIIMYIEPGSRALELEDFLQQINIEDLSFCSKYWEHFRKFF